jgi:hypothetical protein
MPLPHPAPPIDRPDPARTDFWFVGGQSNMLGQLAPRDEEFEPDPRVAVFCTDRRWRTVPEPFYPYTWPHGDCFGLVQGAETATPEVINNGDPNNGCGPSWFWARHLADATGRGIALLHCTTGGTIGDRWAADGFYDLLLDHAAAGAAGAPVKGVFWYQGESDAVTPDQVAEYEHRFPAFLDRLRTDLGDPSMPVVLVQIARLTNTPGGLERSQVEHAWEVVRDVQHRLPDLCANVSVVAALDLPMCDPIHISGQAERRLARRVAGVTLRQAYGLDGPTPLRAIGVERSGAAQAHVRLAGVNGTLHGDGAGFAVVHPDGTRAPAKAWPDRDSRIVVDAGDPIPAGAALVHAGGMDPEGPAFVDDADLPLPGFGPVPIA